MEIRQGSRQTYTESSGSNTAYELPVSNSACTSSSVTASPARSPAAAQKQITVTKVSTYAAAMYVMFQIHFASHQFLLLPPFIIIRSPTEYCRSRQG